MKNSLLKLSAISLLAATACLPTTNAYDPNAPAELQAPAEVRGWLVLGDVAQSSYMIQLLDSAGQPVRNDDGDVVEVNTRTDGDDAVPGLEDAVPGSFHFPSVRPGAYIVRFDASANGRVDVTDAELRGLELTAGESPAPIALTPQTIADDQFTGSVSALLENATPGDLIVVTLERTGTGDRHVEIASGPGTIDFANVAPGEWRVTATGEGYAPAASPLLQVADGEVQTSLSLLTLGPLFALTDFDSAGLPLAPYLPEDVVRDPSASPGTITAHVRLDAGLVLAQNPDESFAVEVRVAEAPSFSTSAWVPGSGDVAEVSLDPALDDGPRAIHAQLRLCFDQQCECPDVADDGSCADASFRQPLASGVTALSVIVDRQGPRAVLADVGGVPRVTPPDDAPDSWVQSQLLSCAQFGSPLCDEASATTYRAPVVLELFDEVGRVYGHDSTIDDEAAPATPANTTGLGALVTVSTDALPIDKADGDHALRLFAWDAAGNVSLVEERALLVDVSPIALDSPALVFPAGVGPHPEGTPNVEVVGGAEIVVDVATIDETPARWRLVKGDTAVEVSGALVGDLAPYAGAGELVITSGGHLELLPLIAEIEDLAGNRTRQVTARELTLFREGGLVGQVILENLEDVSGTEVRLLRGGALQMSATVGAPASVDLGGPDPATLTLGTDGVFAAEHLPVAVTADSPTELWTVEAIAPDPYGSRAQPVPVAAAETTDVGALDLALPRGAIAGRFVLAGQDGTANNSGIQVTLLDDGGLAVAGAATLADGSYRFDDVPVGTYSVVGAAGGYLASTVVGVTVAPDDTYDVLPNPVELTELSGDFTLCAATGPISAECPAILYTNATTLQVGGIDLTGFAEYRISTSEFDDDAPSPAWSPIVALPPDGFEAPQVTLGGAGDGRYTVYLQLRVDAGNAGDVLSSDVVFDTTPPQGLTLALNDGPGATLPGFTNSLQVGATPNAIAAGADQAPLANHRVVFADAQPGALPGQTLCPIVGGCTVPLDDADEGLHTAWVFSCDQAGNCTDPASAVSAQIVLDTTPPRPTHGFDFEPVGSGITESGGDYYTRTAAYSVRLDVGTAETDGGGAVVDLSSNPVPDVVRYRFGFDSLLSGASWKTLDPVVPAGGSRQVDGAALAPVDGTTQVYVQLSDGAGNVTDLNGTPLSMTLVLDAAPPTVTFALDGGAATTGDVLVDLSINENAADPVVRMWLGVDPNFNPGQYVERTFPLADTTYALPAAAPPGGDGSYTVVARFFDVAGNYADRSATITLDRVAPEPTFLDCQDCVTSGGQVYAPTTDLELDALAQDNLGTVSTVSVSIEHVGTGFDALPQVVAYDGSVDIDLVVLDGMGLPVSPAGLYAVTLTFTDPAGNVSAPVQLSLAYDPTPPSAPGGLAVNATAGFSRIFSPSPCTGSNPCLNDPRPVLTFGGSTDNIDPSVTYLVEVAEDADFDGQVVASTVRQAATPLLVPTSLPDSDYGFRVTALDDAGNEAVSSVITFTIDTTGPDAPSLLPPPSPVSASVESTIFLQWTDEAGAAAYQFQLTQDGVGFSTPLLEQTLPSTSVDVRAALVSGGAVLHHARVRSLDALGNASAWTFGQLVHDDVAPCTLGTPAVSLIGTDAANNYSSSTVVTVTLSCPGGGQQDMRLACDGTVDSESVESFSSVTTCALPDGLRTVDAEVLDEAGNTAPATADSITVDGDPPTIPRFAEQGTTTSSTLFSVGTLAVASVDSGAGLASPGYELHWPQVASGCPSTLNASGWCPWNGVSTRNLNLIEGENRIRARGVDAAGNVSDDDLVIVVRDTTSPAAVVDLDADAGNGEITVTWSPPADADIEGYEVFYGAPTAFGCSSSDLAAYGGQNADQGVSPIDVGENTVLRLTGLAAGTPVCVGVRAYDAVNDGAFSAFADELRPNEVAPRIVGTWTPPAGSATRAVKVREHIAYVPHGCDSTSSCAGAGFSTVDVSDPDNPVTLDTCLSGAYTGMFDIALLGDYAYVANGAWVEIIDVSNPRNISCSSFLSVPNQGASAYDWAMSVAVSPGDGGGPGHLAIAALDAGVWMYTLANPTSPVQVGNYRDASSGQFRAHAVTLQGDYAYVAHEAFPTNAGVEILDISNPASPTPAGTVIDTVPVWDVDVSGSWVAAAINGGTYVFDIPDPTVSQTLSYGDALASRSSQATDVLIYGPYLYATDEDNFNQRHNIDLLALRNLDEVDADLPLAGRAEVNSNNQVNMCTFVSCGTHPGHDATQARRMDIDGLYHYEANFDDGLVIRRLSRPVTLEEIANQAFNAPAANDPGGIGVEVVGHRLLFARNGYIVPVDVSDPLAAVQGTPIAIDNGTSTLERVNDRFIFGGGTGFRMVRPNPDNTFTVTDTWSDGSSSYSTKKTHTAYPYTYVIDGNDSYYAQNARIRTVNLTTMTTANTTALNLGSGGFWYGDLARHRETLYVSAAAQPNVAVIDISTAGSPSLQPALSVGVSAYGLAVHRNRLLVGLSNEMRTYALASPNAPSDPVTLSVSPGRWMDVSGDILVGADQPQGVVVSIEDLSSPTLVGYGGNIALEMNVLMFGKHAVLTDRHDFSLIAFE